MSTTIKTVISALLHVQLIRVVNGTCYIVSYFIIQKKNSNPACVTSSPAYGSMQPNVVDTQCTQQVHYTKAWFKIWYAGTTSVRSVVSVTRKRISMTSPILFLMLNVETIWLVGCWLMLVHATLEYNYMCIVYSSITTILTMLRWCQRHAVNPADQYLREWWSIECMV